jgi:hypothetical protein
MAHLLTTSASKNSLWLRELVALTSLTLFSINPVMANSSQTTESGWMLWQHCFTAGRSQIFVTASALKIVSADHDLIVLTKKPDWKIYLINEKKQLIFQTTEKTWHGRYPLAIHAAMSARLLGMGKSRESQVTLLGLPATKVLLTPNAQPANAEPNSSLFSADYWVTDKFGISASACRIMERYFLLPPSDYFPLRLYTHSNMTNTELETDSCKKMDIPESTFAVPKDFRQAPNAESVLPMENKNQFLDDLLDSYK